MSLKGGFSKSFVAEYFKNGVLVPDEKIKLLLILIYSDKMGRKPQSEESIEKNDQALKTASEKSKTNAEKNKKQDYPNPGRYDQKFENEKSSPKPNSWCCKIQIPNRRY